MSDIKRQLGHLRGESGKSQSKNSSIKEKLDRLYNRDAPEKYFPEEQVVRSHKRLEELITGEYVNTTAGDVFRARTQFDEEYVHGDVCINDVHSIDPERLAKLGKISDRQPLDIRRALFLDTEASGLSGGTGTYAFMIGIGYFEHDILYVDQLFVDSYAKEEGMLDILRDYCEQASMIVSFNGKSFDLSLLETRYLMHGQSSPFTKVPHLDLLHPARNLWNLDLQNCRLQTIEAEVLRFYRQDDTPGAEVPGIYFEFLRTGDPDEIAGVFEHNVHDIVSLVAVTTLLDQNFAGIRETPVESGLTSFSRGKIFEKQGDLEQAVECFRASLNTEVSSTRRQKILSSLAGIYKRQKRWELALPLWQKMIQQVNMFALEPYEELAKYYEHRVKNFSTALDYVEAALAQIPKHRTEDIAAMTHRRNRLQRKLE
jgi:hypothetical protein